MSTTSTSVSLVSPAKEIVERLEACLNANGLTKTQEHFAGMEQILSALPWWGMVKTAADRLFAKERKRQEKLELAHIRAGAPKVTQILPAATSGVDVNSSGNNIAKFIKIEDHDENN